MTPDNEDELRRLGEMFEDMIAKAQGKVKVPTTESVVRTGRNLSELMDLEYAEFVGGCKQWPEMKKILEPRRIPTPNGYHSYRQAAAMSLAMTVNCYSVFANQRAVPPLNITVYSAYHVLTNEGQRIFYVDEEFARACAATDLPEELTIGDIKTPLPGFFLAFPREFMIEYCGTDVSYIAVASIPKGEVPPHPELNRIFNGKLPIIQTPEQKLGVTYFYTVPEPNEPGRYTLGTQISVYFITEQIGGVFDRYTYLEYTPQRVDEVASITNKERIDRITALVYKVLLVLEARPEFAEKLTMQRPAKIRHGHVVREELWAPTFVGRGYKSPSEHQGGTHASPKLHRRRGHMRMQPYGPRDLKQRKPKWIEPMWIGLGGEPSK